MALTFDDVQTVELLEVLGLPHANGDSATVLATVKDLAAQLAELITKQEETPAEAKASASSIAAAAREHGLQVVDGETFDDLKRVAEEGRQIKAAAAHKAITDKVDEAIAAAKIPPARRDHWVGLISADPGMADVLAAVPDETVASLSDLGHSINPDGDDVTEPAEWFRP